MIAPGSFRPVCEYTEDQLRLAARLYYGDGLAQMEVARLVKVSQAKVSRLLAAARKQGIVRITVAPYDPRCGDLERRLKNALGLETAIVIKTVDGLPPADCARAIAHFAGPQVAALIPPLSVVAIAGGRTMHELVHHLPEQRDRHITVVQAMGSIDSNVGPVDASELGRVLAARFGGYFLTLNTPAFVPDKRTRDSFLELPQIQSVKRHLARATVALIGIGTLGNSLFLDRGVISREHCDRLAARGAVGEICGRFFDRLGRECDSPWRDRVLSIELDQLRRVPQVIGAVAGTDRSAALAAAIRGGLLNTLIIDEAGALALLEADIQSPAKLKNGTNRK